MIGLGADAIAVAVELAAELTPAAQAHAGASGPTYMLDRASAKTPADAASSAPSAPPMTSSAGRVRSHSRSTRYTPAAPISAITARPVVRTCG